jgi:hypothetical protein
MTRTPALRGATAIVVICLLSACSSADDHDRGSSRRPQAQGSPPPTSSAVTAPAAPVRVTVQQARAVALVGQRHADQTVATPPENALNGSNFCERDTPYEAQPGRGWVSVTSTPNNAGTGLSAATKLDHTAVGTAVLDGQDRIAEIDELIRIWSSCTGPKGTVRTRLPTTVTADAIALMRIEEPKAPVAERHQVDAYARVGNLFIVCEAKGPRQGPPRATVTSCLTDTVAAAKGLSAPTVADRIGGFMLAAQFADKRWETASGTVINQPCPTSKDPDLATGSPTISISTPPEPGAEAGTDVGEATIQVFDSPSAAVAKVAEMKTHLSTCPKAWTDRPGTYPSPAKITGLTPNSIGDDGATLAWQVKYRAFPRPSRSRELVFSAGRAVVHFHGFNGSPAAVKAQQAAAEALVEYLTRALPRAA